jgi:AcrR family transcriptional regulator
MHELSTDLRSKTIVEAAVSVFLNYGFKRATMDDIARASGMSRPALYLVYRNKNEIYRACMISMMAEVLEAVSTCLDAPGGPVEKVSNALLAGIYEPFRQISATPHGAEILDLKSGIAADLFSDWMAGLERELSRSLSLDVEAGKLDLSGSNITIEEIASLIVDGAEGIKYRAASPDELPGKLGNLAALILRGFLTA